MDCRLEEKSGFLGADVLRQQRPEGVRRKSSDFEMAEPASHARATDVYVDASRPAP